jgi:hypothetical protein
MKNTRVTNWETFFIDIGDLVGGFIIGLSLHTPTKVGIIIGTGCVIGSFYFKFKKGYYKK